MKSTRSKTRHYKHGEIIKKRGIAKLWTFRAVYMTTMFYISVSVFSILFSTTAKELAMAPSSKNMSILSMDGRSGATKPSNTNAKKPSPSRSIQSLANITARIPAKPSWTSMQLFVDPNNGATQYIANNPSASGASYIDRMSRIPVAQWFGDWNSDVKKDANYYVSNATAIGKVPVLVAYNIPNRDCGGYSVGGASSVNNYIQWVQQLATGIGDRTAVVVLEPDALGAVDCLPDSLRQDRYNAISQAVTIIKAYPKISVYIDAGTPVWQPATVMSSRLKSANIATADGFSLNVSYFAPTSQNKAYGDKLSSMVGYKHYIVDTSRNGGNHEVSGAICNPSFASFGETPTTNTDSALLDALLWIKIPWESDGQCNGSPGPGQEYWDYAIRLAQNAGW